ncbi:SSU ribosomal protein S8P [Candidatus Thermokryptus mobilis]|uniref:Small ribosomal subunit protein uS8 n=2 Tax=Candidatus Thermokryptus mobilis TaxID=1643428 RepID=A0A0S4MQ66_9BACT|nr:SSU ribosomal protein S8P [Candidatus Thermokryptus mobilis]
MTDPIADFLTRIRNAVRARHKVVEAPSSKLKRAIAQILLEQKFINGYEVIEDGKQGILRIYLKYAEDGEPAITNLVRVSKPGRRIYVGVEEIPRVLNGLGIAILSTSKGVMTDRRARKERVGGEVICYVW